MELDSNFEEIEFKNMTDDQLRMKAAEDYNLPPEATWEEIEEAAYERGDNAPKRGHATES